uniref:Histone-lysine N-methyltransferase n=1 Tax=Chenopodium quinoa TaxID=63459 RepID=A0A803KX49_CHEQI
MSPFSLTQKQFPINGSVHRTAAPSPASSSSETTKKERKYKTIAEIYAKAKYAVVEKEDYSDIKCEECGSGDGEMELLLCDKCDKGFHMNCVRPIVTRVPIGSWLCPSCSGQPRVRNTKKRRRRPGTLVCYKKKKRRLLPYVPTDDLAQRLEQMGSLARALTALKMEFSNDLTYVPGMAPRSANQAILEDGGMQDYETVKHCRAMLRRGECPPLLVVYDSCEGYTVQADAPIKDMTILAEYAGDVDFIKNRERDDCDSLMTLLLASDPSKSLVICPDKRGNIARFISGINNHTPESKKKQNLKCVRYDVNGECCVLLVVTRDIAKGERLYYDYN